jgi:hypothetical protein
METSETELEQVKADVYETWGVINRAFEQIVTALHKLEKTGVLKWDYVHNQSVITNDLWAKINLTSWKQWEGAKRTTVTTTSGCEPRLRDGLGDASDISYSHPLIFASLTGESAQRV